MVAVNDHSPTAASEALLGNCPVCDQMFVTTVTWFGHPMNKVVLLVEHLPDGAHRPHVRAGAPLSEAELQAYRDNGWAQDWQHD